MRGLVAVLGFGIALAWAGATLAHEGHQHPADKVMGTVIQVHAADVSHIEVKTSHGETVILTVDATTKYLKGKTPAVLADVKAGAHIVATVTKDSQVNKVSEIQIGVSESAAHKH